MNSSRSIQIVGTSSASHSLREFIKQIGLTNIDVLITGETGTGKEVVARALHENSPRRSKPFVAVNCAGIPENLIESELFGHERGSFTGALRDRKGKFALADGGTIFLDEIGDASIGLQTKLLRVLQEREIVPLGSEVSMLVDVRVISATNRDLSQAIKASHFRSDLYFRLCVDSIHIPPLRERAEDISILAEYFLSILSLRHSLHGTKKISPEAIKVLQDYPWYGNVRELRNVIERVLCYISEENIRVEHLPKFLFQDDKCKDNHDATLKKQFKNILNKNEGTLLDYIEKTFIEMTLQETKGNKQKTARLLGCALNTLKTKIIKYGLTPCYADYHDLTGVMSDLNLNKNA